MSRSDRAIAPVVIGSRRPQFLVLSSLLLVVVAVGLWWFASPWRWVRQAEALLSVDPAQADELATAALNEGTNAAARAWLVRCRAHLAMKHPLEATGAFVQIERPQECDVNAWCALIEEAQAAKAELLADLAMTAALQFRGKMTRDDRRRMLTLAIPLKADTLSDAESAELVNELRSLAGDHADSWYALGLAERTRERLAESVESHRRAVALSRADQSVGLPARRELARLLIELGQFEDALPPLTEVLESSSATLEDRVWQAQWQRATSDRTGAEQTVDLVLKQQPDQIAARLLHGTLLAEREQLEEAQADFEQCLTIAPFHAEAHYRLAQLLLRRGDSAAANQHLAEHRRLTDLKLRVLQLNRRRAASPEDPVVLAELATCLESLGQPETAAALRRSLERSKSSIRPRPLK